jgi:hypothetical protein
VLKARDFAEVNKATRDGDFAVFIELVGRLRTRPPQERMRGVTRDLFDMPPVEAMAAFNAAHAQASFTL